MRLAVRLPDWGWVEFVGFGKLSLNHQTQELQEIRRIKIEFKLVPENEPFFSTKPSED